jgi:CII-binding regulator of phage lambda lysogenization HflD
MSAFITLLQSHLFLSYYLRTIYFLRDRCIARGSQVFSARCSFVIPAIRGGNVWSQVSGTKLFLIGFRKRGPFHVSGQVTNH